MSQKELDMEEIGWKVKKFLNTNGSTYEYNEFAIGIIIVYHCGNFSFDFHEWLDGNHFPIIVSLIKIDDYYSVIKIGEQ